MRTFPTTLLAMALALSATASFAAKMSSEAPTQTVNYATLDLSSSAGAEQLYQRLKSAARQVCAHEDGAALSSKHRYRICVDTALSNAIVQVDNALVKNIHDRKHGNGAAIRIASARQS